MENLKVIKNAIKVLKETETLDKYKTYHLEAYRQDNKTVLSILARGNCIIKTWKVTTKISFLDMIVRNNNCVTRKYVNRKGNKKLFIVTNKG